MDEKSRKFAMRIRRDGHFIGKSRIDRNEIFKLGDNVWKLTSRGVEKVAALVDMIGQGNSEMNRSRSYPKSAYSDYIAQNLAIQHDIHTFGNLSHPESLEDDIPNQNLGYPTSKLPTLAEFMKKEHLSDVLTAGNQTNAWMGKYTSFHSLNE